MAGLDDVELVGVADVSAAQARQVADRHNTRAYTHFGPLLDRADAACIVALPLAAAPHKAGRSAVGALVVIVAAAAVYLVFRQLDRRHLRR